MSAARVRTSRVIDTIGVLAVVVGLVLGLVPGVAVPSARADDSCDGLTRENGGFTVNRVLLELDSQEDADDDVDLVVDTDDVNVACSLVSNALRITLKSFGGKANVNLVTDGGDAPDFHISCSEDFGAYTITIDGVDYDVVARRADINKKNQGYSGFCEPFPPDPATASVRKVDDEGSGLSGAEFTLYLQGTTTKATTEHDNPCTTDATGGCDFGELEAGDYTMTETKVPAGYRFASPVSQDFTLNPDQAETRTFTDPRIDYTIDVTPDGRNAVGNDHDFTVTLLADGSPLAGATVGLDWSGVGSIQGPGSSCTTAGDGVCTVTVESDDPGSGVLTATFDTPYQNDNGQTAGPDRDDQVAVSTGGTAYDRIADAASKSWVGYVATITPTETNLASNTLAPAAGVHVFTAHVQEDDGSGTPPDASGVLVNVSWSGAPSGATISSNTADPLQCLTGADGTCTFTVDSPNPGAGTVEIVELNGMVLGLDGSSAADGEPLQVLDPKTSAGEEPTATKTWREYRARLDGDAINPVGEPHDFTVTVEYTEDGRSWQRAGSGLFVDWSTGVGDDGSDDLAASTCDDDPSDATDGTDGSGQCVITVTSGAVGSRTVTLTAVTGALLPNDATSYSYPVSARQFLENDDADDDADSIATKTWLDFSAQITPTEHNQVGEPHIFEVKVFRTGGGGGNAVPDGTTVTTSLSWDGTDQLADVDVTDNCATSGVQGDVCTIVVNSDVAGKLTVAVTGLKDYQFDGATRDIVFAPQPTASKTWWEYRAWVEPSATNVVGDPHTFTVHAERNDGSPLGWRAVQDGTIVTVSQGGTVGSITTNECEDASVGTSGGTCDVVVTSPSPGKLTLSVETVQALDAIHSEVPSPDNPTADVSDGEHLNTQPGESDQAVTATKTWVEYSATISGDATNLTDEDHPFRILAFVDAGDGNGAVPVAAGTQVTASLSDGSHLVVDTCGNGTGNDTDTDDDLPDETGANECWVVVGSDAADAVDVTVDEVQATDVTATVKPFASVASSNATATKTWIDVLVDIDPDDPTNIAGDAHEFTVDLTINGPGDTTIDHTGASVGFTVDGAVVVHDDELEGVVGSTCDDALAAGQDSCTIVVHSETAGTADIRVTSVEFTYGGKPFGPIDFSDTGSEIGKAAGQDLSATKSWLQYRATIEADALNLVRDAHEFTVTIEQTDLAAPGDGDWSPVEGALPTVARQGAGVGDVVADVGTCDEGTDATGQCTVRVNSSVVGTGTFEVRSVQVVDPESTDDLTSWRELGSAHVAFDNTDTADKTWIAFTADITPRTALNVVGDDHPFHVDVRWTADGATWEQVPPGSVVTVSDNSADPDAVGSISGHTCASTMRIAGENPHVCVVTVDSEHPGSLTVSVDRVTATIDIPDDGVEATTFTDVTFDAGASGILTGFSEADTRGSKSWGGYRLELAPPTAVNLLDGSDEDDQKDHDIVAILTSEDGVMAPVGGQDVSVVLTDAPTSGRIHAVSDGSVRSATEATCTTGVVTPAAGEQSSTCTITIRTDDPGRAELDARYTSDEIFDGQSQTVVADTDTEVQGNQGAEKIWTTFRVLVDPLSDQNIVGNWHVFTVTVEESDLQGGWKPVTGASHPSDLDFVISGTNLTVSTDGAGGAPASAVPYCDSGTDTDGRCALAVNTGDVQAISVRATYTESYDSYSSGTGDAVFGSPDAGKEWIDYAISLTPPTADNLVNTTHVFTVTVGRATSASGGDFLGLPGVTPDVGKVSGPGTITGGTCVDGVTDAQGRCTIELFSSETGLTTVGASYLGRNAAATESKLVESTATKQWWNHDLEINPPEATNAVGDDHTFTATLRVDTGQGLGPAAGERLQFTVGGVGAVTGGDVDGDLTCTTDAAGECDIVINSDEGGDTDVVVTYGAQAGETSATLSDEAVKHWVDIDLVKTAVVGDGFADGDLVADPGTGLPTLFFTTSDRGPKTAVFEYLITNTGGDDLFDLALVDDRLGGIDLATQSDCPDVLAVGASCTARATEQYTYDDAAGGFDNIIVNVGLVTASGDDGSEVSATDDAVIQLIAQQSSILIDLVKDVVVGAGDVRGIDGPPTVTWSQSELAGNASKVVRYRFTVTNIGPSPIVDVELADPMIGSQPIIAAVDGVSLQPGESTTVEVDHLLTAQEAFPDGPTAGDVPNVATVRGANETRDAFDQDSDDAIVFVQVVFAEVEEPLPATGLDAGNTLPVSLLLVTLGAAILWLERRRVAIR